MKMKRMIASVLALLLMVSLLPIGAMADEMFTYPNGIIEEGKEVTYNVATDVTNNGKVSNNGPRASSPPSILYNNGTVVNNGGSSNGDSGTVVYNSADCTVENNKKTGTVEHNYGLVTNNTGTVEKNESGGTVVNNNGTVFNNNEGGTVETNDGEIKTNSGTVGKKEDGQVVDGSGNNHAIGTNYGTVISNNENGIVGTNADTGKIEINDGTVGTYDVNFHPNDLTGNLGTIGINNGTVTSNKAEATIVTNNGKVASNYGTVETNAIDGVVYNEDTFFENAPRSRDNENAAAPEEKPNVDGVGTNFGTVFDKTEEGTKTTYYGLSWGDNVQNLTLINGKMPGNADPVNLNDYAAKASLSGYRMTGYTAFARRNGADSQISDTTNHLMDAPVWLKIDWEKIVSIFKPASSNEPEAKPVKTTPVHTSLSADQVKVGAYVRCGNMTFKIIEVTDNDIRVATVGKLSEQDLADMLGCLKKHLSDAQIEKLIGEPELLEQELVARFFADSREHIAFRASRDLFA